MTAPRDSIVFNNVDGSDTAASGLGPSTAVTGTAAAHTGGAASTTITLTNTPDLSGVQVGDLLWLNTSSGRQFSVISAVDDGADTVTVDDSFTIAGASAVNYAIGGKRATLNEANSRKLFDNGSSTGDAKGGWRIKLEYTGTNYSWTSQYSFRGMGSLTLGPVEIYSDSTIKPKISFSRTDYGSFVDASRVNSTSHLKFKNICFYAHGTNELDSMILVQAGSDSTLQFHSCDFDNDITGDATNMEAVSANNITDCRFLFVNCTFTGFQANCVFLSGDHARSSIVMIGCTASQFRTYLTNEISLVNTRAGFVVIINCLILGAKNKALKLTSNTFGTGTVIYGNTIHGSTGDGVEVNDEALRGSVIVNNIFTNNAIGLHTPPSGATQFGYIDHNVFYNNTIAKSGYPINTDELEIDPQYTDANNLNFTPTNPLLKGAAFPTSL